MQEDRAELFTSLLFFHFFRTATPLTQETRPRLWENTQFEQLARAGQRGIAGSAGASGTALHPLGCGGAPRGAGQGGDGSLGTRGLSPSRRGPLQAATWRCGPPPGPRSGGRASART